MIKPELGKYEKIMNKATLNIIVLACFIIIIAIMITVEKSPSCFANMTGFQLATE